MDTIRYNNGYFYDDPRDYRPGCQPDCRPEDHYPLPDYMHIDQYERTPQLFGVLTFCGEQGPAGAAVLGSSLNADIILAGDGSHITGKAYTAAAIEG